MTVFMRSFWYNRNWLDIIATFALSKSVYWYHPIQRACICSPSSDFSIGLKNGVEPIIAVSPLDLAKPRSRDILQFFDHSHIFPGLCSSAIEAPAIFPKNDNTQLIDSARSGGQMSHHLGKRCPGSVFIRLLILLCVLFHWPYWPCIIVQMASIKLWITPSTLRTLPPIF